ncbi:hypothetical protein ACRAWF_25775 [Streptomyces sp. L7]
MTASVPSASARTAATRLCSNTLSRREPSVLAIERGRTRLAVDPVTRRVSFLPGSRLLLVGPVGAMEPPGLLLAVFWGYATVA